MPKGYWVAHVTITDPERYTGYQDIAPKAFQKYNITFLARGGASKSLEGDSWERHVIIEFDSFEQALECYESAEYKRARAQRGNACNANITLIEGMD